MKSQEELQQELNRIDHRGYPAYKDLKGAYRFSDYILSIDHVQGDPFAAPSRVSIHISGKEGGFPQELYNTPEKRIALQDYILRAYGRVVEVHSFHAKGSGKSGLMSVSRPGPEILDRSGCQIHPGSGGIILRMEIGFPANGRTVNSRELEKILFDYVPKCVRSSLFYKSLPKEALEKNADLAEDQTYIRQQLKELDYVAFVADGSVLPRESGVSRRPMKGAVAFSSPENLKITFDLPHAGRMTGMGIKKGVTLIVGGGYHGKSTLLGAVEAGIYNHIPGDGREYVITDDTAMKLRAEDGRSIKDVDISMFINHLPNGKDTVHFSTDDASGSTSQAANMIEAMESGSKVFLIDEDTSATNFMVRDELMQRVVSRDSEPITPFVDRIRELYERYGISTILVAGSSGSYFERADRILQMDCYKPYDITDRAKKEAEAFSSKEKPLELSRKPDFNRRPLPVRADQRKSGGLGGGRNGSFRENQLSGRGHGRSGNPRDERIKIKTTGCDTVTINKENIDMRYVEQLVDVEQMNMLGQITAYLTGKKFDGKLTMIEIVDQLVSEMKTKGFSVVCGDTPPGNLTIPRKQEICACINRYRKIMFSK